MWHFNGFDLVGPNIIFYHTCLYIDGYLIKNEITNEYIFDPEEF
jgi:hypothetical protein